MSNGARHGLGVLLGLIATPVLALGLAYGPARTLHSFQTLQPFSDRAPWVLLLVEAGLLAGLLAGSRVSPLASLTPGLVLAGYGVFWQVSLVRAADLTDPLPAELKRGLDLGGGSGLLLVLGTLLVAASLPPSRWKGRRTAAAQPRHAAPPAQAPEPMEPMGPPPGPPQYGRQQLPQYEQNPRLGGPGQGAPGQGAPGQGAPGQGDRPPSGAVPFGNEPKPSRKDDDDPGEWTQMYGGGR
ncbi:hypothetical protein ACFVH6_00890 [Spirillospora sp. NPDC127200]